MPFDLLFPLIIYFLIVILISVFYYKKQKNNSLEGYFLGNRSLNGTVLAMTLVATYISASSFIGGPAAAYQYGLSWILISTIQIPTVLLSLSILGKKFADFAQKHNAITLNDWLFARYKNSFLIVLSSILLIVAFWGAMTAQLIGGARLLESALNIPYIYSLIFFTVFTAFYTAIGGFKAGAINDVIQGFIMLLGALLLLFLTIWKTGGIENAIGQIQQIDPKLLSPKGANDFVTLPLVLSFWVLVCFGVIGLPHNALRCMTYKEPTANFKAIILGTIVISTMLIAIHLSGFLGRALIPNLEVVDHIIPRLMTETLSPFFAGIFLAAPLAAIMSTINAQLLQVSSTLLNDLFLRFFPKFRTSNNLIFISIFLTFFIGLLLLLTAINPPNMIIWLNLLSFGGLQTIFLWPLVLGLYWKRANYIGALTSIFLGSGSYLFFVIFSIKPFDFHPIVPALSIGFISFLMGNFALTFFKKNHELETIKN